MRLKLGKTNFEGEVRNRSWTPLCCSLGTYLEGECCATKNLVRTIDVADEKLHSSLFYKSRAK